MKKLFLALVIGLLLVAALTTTALADNGPHGGAAFASGSTDACASCHRAHTAQSTNAGGDLLKASSILGLCSSCHDGTGAYTDVMDGHYDSSAPPIYPWTLSPSTGEGDPGAPLFGGGFVNTEMRHTWSGEAYYDNFTLISQSVTSAHQVDGATSGTVWGSGAYSSTDSRGATGSGTLTLDCTSCHDPHGFAGKDNTGKSIPSYRLLKWEPDGSNGFELSATALGTGGQTSALFTNANSGALDQVAGSTGGATILEPAGMGASSADGYKATKWWYTLNSNWTLDPLIAALGVPHSWAAGQPWESASNGYGDYGPDGRGFTYIRPAFNTTYNAVTNKTPASYWCYDPTAATLPANPPFASTTGGYATYTGNCASFMSTYVGTLGTSFDNSKARVALGLFCAQCHDRYFEASGSATKNTGDAVFMYQHASGAAALNSHGVMTDPSITCVDCHNAHGTSSIADSLSSSASLAGDAALLKLDNRSMCATCHGPGINFQFAAPAVPTATPLP